MLLLLHPLLVSILISVNKQIPTPLKIKMFMWCICNNVIATSSNLLNWKCAQSLPCQICFQESETVEHMLFGCTWPLLDSSTTVCSLFHFIFVPISSKKIARNILATFAFTSWAIWKSRNTHIFEICQSITTILIV